MHWQAAVFHWQRLGLRTSSSVTRYSFKLQVATGPGYWHGTAVIGLMTDSDYSEVLELAAGTAQMRTC